MFILQIKTNSSDTLGYEFHEYIIHTDSRSNAKIYELRGLRYSIFDKVNLMLVKVESLESKEDLDLII